MKILPKTLLLIGLLFVIEGIASACVCMELSNPLTPDASEAVQSLPITSISRQIIRGIDHLMILFPVAYRGRIRAVSRSH
jgi:hypothetical protein